MYYAQINENNICVAISQVAGELNDSKHVPVEGLNEDLLWRKYDNGQWSTEKHIPGTVTMTAEAAELLLSTIDRLNTEIVGLNEIVDILILDSLSNVGV